MTKKSFILPGLILAALIGFAFFSITGRIWQAPSSYSPKSGSEILTEAYANRQSGMVVEIEGEVKRLMMDRPQSAKQQRFVIQAVNGQALLVTHQLGKSEKIPLAAGDTVLVRGEYRWTEPGGELISTHRRGSSNPRNGWIEHKGKHHD